MDEKNMFEDCVDRFYAMDPKTDDVVFGKNLQHGMVVLIEEITSRCDMNSKHTNGALVKNRWCTVTQLSWDRRQDLVQFIGEYDDGFKATRIYANHMGWIVKKSSVEELAGRQERMYGIVKQALLDSHGITSALLPEYDSLADVIARSVITSKV